ncbi:protein of unknown function [Xenorhabdus doucetiae]|uniref:Uncharacterized protein n=1 Tax=Xenorhabdus doucetiae TaxID=351671 RepID=A0A068QV18_9GAMM|nr:protein of unknown function [Xenorhabdus doucetiae]
MHQFEGTFLFWCQMNFHDCKHDRVWIRNQASSMAIGIYDISATFAIDISGINISAEAAIIIPELRYFNFIIFPFI